MQISQIKMLITCLITTAILATAILAQSAKGGAANIRPTRSAENDLRDCSQMLDQSLAETRVLKEQIAALEKLAAAQLEVIEKLREQAGEQKKMIELYERRRGMRISFFWGLIKVQKN